MIHRNLLLAGAGLLALSACSAMRKEPPATVAAAPIAPPAAPAPKPELGTYGYDASGMDRSVAPGDDFYKYVNGGWAKVTEIPADRASYTMFARLDDLSKERTRTIIEDAAKVQAAPGSSIQKVGDYYASFMDEGAIEAKGVAPLAADLARVDAIKTRGDFARAVGMEQRANGATLFAMGVGQDDKSPETYIPNFYQAGLGLPDRDYYLVDNPKFVETRAAYKAHISKMLMLAGVPEAVAATKADAIFRFEAKIAAVHWTRVDSRDSDKTYNRWSAADFVRKAPGFDWKAYMAANGLSGETTFLVAQPSAYTGMAKLVAATPVATLKDWLAYHVIADRAPVLPKAFVDEDFAFNGTVLSGQPQLQPRWKRGVDQVNGAMGEAVGELYVARYFTPKAKAEADELVHNLIVAMDDRLSRLEWMAPETKAKARAKLASFNPKIGYPDKWRDYSALTIVRGDAYGNAVRAAEFEYDRGLKKLGAPLDRGEWFMTPMTVNAYANPTMNEVVFPASILQPPFFDPNADPAVNYGGIGAVIGHEISHHFDDQGRKYDPKGALADWWTAEDVKRFKAYTDRVEAQYAGYEPLPGMHVNGGLTLGENMADLAGVTVALDAYHKSLNGEPAPVIDGLTGDQRFFLGFGQVWRAKYREANLRNRLTTDPHTPGNWRPYVVRNLDAWYSAFDVKPGQKYYLTPEQRIKVW